MLPVTVSGLYWDTPGECEKCFVRSAYGEGIMGPMMGTTDWLTMDDAHGVEATPISSGQGRIFHNAPTGSYGLVEGLDVHIIADVLGK